MRSPNPTMQTSGVAGCGNQRDAATPSAPAKNTTEGPINSSAQTTDVTESPLAIQASSIAWRAMVRKARKRMLITTLPALAADPVGITIGGSASVRPFALRVSQPPSRVAAAASGNMVQARMTLTRFKTGNSPRNSPMAKSADVRKAIHVTGCLAIVRASKRAKERTTDRSRLFGLA